MSIIAPWAMDEYPGKTAILGQVLGTCTGTTLELTKSRHGFPPKHARRLAEYLRARVMREEALIRELDAYICSREAEIEAAAWNFKKGDDARRRKWPVKDPDLIEP